MLLGGLSRGGGTNTAGPELFRLCYTVTVMEWLGEFWEELVSGRMDSFNGVASMHANTGLFEARVDALDVWERCSLL